MRTKVHWAGNTGIGFMARPRGGEWLKDEMLALREDGVKVLVSMLTPAEAHRLGLEDESKVAEAEGIKFISLPVVDHGIPSSTQDTLQTIKSIADQNAKGDKIVLHCFAGIGRSAMISACVLVERGHTVDDAIKMLSRARGFEVPETEEQEEWIRQYAKANQSR